MRERQNPVQSPRTRHILHGPFVLNLPGGHGLDWGDAQALSSKLTPVPKHHCVRHLRQLKQPHTWDLRVRHMTCTTPNQTHHLHTTPQIMRLLLHMYTSVVSSMHLLLVRIVSHCDGWVLKSCLKCHLMGGATLILVENLLPFILLTMVILQQFMSPSMQLAKMCLSYFSNFISLCIASS